MNVEFSNAAESDLERIGDYIAADNARRAATFVRELRRSCEGIGALPLAFRLLPRHEKSGIRRRVHGNYLIFYKISGQVVTIIHILHGAMDYEAVLFPKG